MHVLYLMHPHLLRVKYQQLIVQFLGLQHMFLDRKFIGFQHCLKFVVHPSKHNHIHSKILYNTPGFITFIFIFRTNIIFFKIIIKIFKSVDI